jgi:hypothetical protein
MKLEKLGATIFKKCWNGQQISSSSRRFWTYHPLPSTDHPCNFTRLQMPSLVTFMNLGNFTIDTHPQHDQARILSTLISNYSSPHVYHTTIYRTNIKLHSSTCHLLLPVTCSTETSGSPQTTRRYSPKDRSLVYYSTTLTTESTQIYYQYRHLQDKKLIQCSAIFKDGTWSRITFKLNLILPYNSVIAVYSLCCRRIIFSNMLRFKARDC